MITFRPPKSDSVIVWRTFAAVVKEDVPPPQKIRRTYTLGKATHPLVRQI